MVGFEQFRPGHDRGSSHGDTRIFRTAYFEGPEYVPLLQRAHHVWRELEKESGAELLTMTGGLAIGPRDGELVAGVLASAKENRLPHRLLDPIELGRIYPQHRLRDEDVGVLDEQAGFLRPERSIAAAASCAEALGARLSPETRVTSVQSSSGGVVIETTGGSYRAERALVTAGAWTSKLLPQLGLPLAVERQVMAWLAVDDPASFGPQRFPIFIRETAPGRFRYGFPSTDGRSIKIAVHHEGRPADPDSINREVVDADLLPIRDFAREHLRGAKGDVVDARVCMYTNTPDERFLAISPASMPGVTVLSACSGHGFKFASVMGDLVADLIVDGRALPAIIRSVPPARG